MTEPQQAQSSTEPNFVAFRSADQDYCVDIMSVREIRGWTPATALPRVPPYIRGVINLRGAVVPIIDFSVRLGLTTSELSKRHVVIIVQILDQTVGLLVEEVSEILSIHPEAIKPTPEIGCKKSEAFVAGVAEFEDRLVRLINLERVFPALEGVQE